MGKRRTTRSACGQDKRTERLEHYPVIRLQADESDALSFVSLYVICDAAQSTYFRGYILSATSMPGQ